MGRFVIRAGATAPIDLAATGLIGGTKIDEVVICGRLDAPSTARIGAVSWRVSLREFEIGKGGASCPWGPAARGLELRRERIESPGRRRGALLGASPELANAKPSR